MSTPVDIQYPLSLAETLAPKPVCEDVSIVISTLGRDILETCLAYIAAGSRWPAQLIVVDQGRVPAVEAMMARLQAAGMNALYVPSTPRGRSSRHARGRPRSRWTRRAAPSSSRCGSTSRR